MQKADSGRAAVSVRGHLGVVSDWMTPTVASLLEFHELVPYKSLLKRYFSSTPWTDEDEAQLDGLVASKLPERWSDELDLGDGLVVSHGVAGGRYRISVSGAPEQAPSIWDRVFDGPVVPEPTPHLRKVKFDLGGDPSPGVWYRRGDDAGDERVLRLFEETDVTDVMVAGDFVTIGIDRTSSWEQRLDPLLALVVALFPAGERSEDGRTRDELVAEGKGLDLSSADRLHLLNPDDPEARDLLHRALDADDARVRRIAVVILAESLDHDVAHAALHAGLADGSRIVRRAAVDAAADRENEALRDLFEAALLDGDPWRRWKAVRALGDLGIDPSRRPVTALEEDDDFQVRFEVARVLRD